MVIVVFVGAVVYIVSGMETGATATWSIMARGFGSAMCGLCISWVNNGDNSSRVIGGGGSMA